MTRLRVVLAMLLLVVASALAQKQKRDPLNDLEIDKLRETAQQPEERLKLYIGVERAGVDKLQQIRYDPKAKDLEQQARDVLRDFSDEYDELADDVDTMAGRG